MQFFGMLIYGRRCLGAAVAFRVIEIHGGDRVLAENAVERNAAVQRLGGVVAHTFIVVFPPETGGKLKTSACLTADGRRRAVARRGSPLLFGTTVVPLRRGEPNCLCQLNLQTLVLVQQHGLGFLRVHRTVVQLVAIEEDLDERWPRGDGALDQRLR
jgi:hypothetical protein